jgi:hypothetical protein
MAVTAITFDPRIDLPSGNLGSQPITLKATPTRIRENGTQTVYPETVTFTDVTGDTAIHLQSTDGSWAWTIGAYRRLKIVDIRTVFVTGETANWNDLVDIDPDTFLPSDQPTTVGQMLSTLQTQVDGIPALITAAVTALIGGAPVSVDTLGEIAATLGTYPSIYPQLRPTPPDPTIAPAYIDTSTVPPVLKGWDGTAWVPLGSGGSSTAPDNVLVTDTGDYLVTDTGDYLLIA